MKTAGGSQLTASAIRLALVCAFGMLALLVLSCRQYRPPLDPIAPEGLNVGMPGISYKYGAATSDPDGDRIQYEFDWGDSTPSDTSEAALGDSIVWMLHAWADTGTYNVRVIARDVYNRASEWSSPRRVAISENAPDFSLPDVNGNLVSLYPLLAAGPVYMVWWDLTEVTGIAEIDELQPVFDSLSPHGFTLLALSLDKAADESRVRSFVVSKGWHNPVLLDPSMVSKQQYGIVIRPTGILVSMDTAVVYTYLGHKKGDADRIKAEILKWMPPKVRAPGP